MVVDWIVLKSYLTSSSVRYFIGGDDPVGYRNSFLGFLYHGIAGEGAFVMWIPDRLAILLSAFKCFNLMEPLIS